MMTWLRRWCGGSFRTRRLLLALFLLGLVAVLQSNFMMMNRLEDNTNQKQVIPEVISQTSRPLTVGSANTSVIAWRWGFTLLEDRALGMRRKEMILQMFKRNATLRAGGVGNDRILEQLKYRSIKRSRGPDGKVRLKTIITMNMKTGKKNLGQKIFLRDNCPVNTCSIETRTSLKPELADAVVFNTVSVKQLNKMAKGGDSVWVWYELESPFHSAVNPMMNHLVNWTASYRRDSTIVTPYEKFVHFRNFTKLPKKADVNYAEGKKRLVAWFVSNCKDQTGRLNYAMELNKYIQVDIYGACGNYSCPRRAYATCFEMLNNNYKFYLSFENSACRDYITEKFFSNGLRNNLVPIVMGAHPEDYAAVAPPHSYIHVDDFRSPRDLANYLHFLDTHDNHYNQYFRWKGTGEFINTKFWCRLCGMLHAREEVGLRQWYSHIYDWAMIGERGSVCLDNREQLWTSWQNGPYNYTMTGSQIGTVIQDRN